MRDDGRYQLRNPGAALRSPLFLIPSIAFPMAGALLVWFTRDDLERSAWYWTFFGAFQVFWTWAILRNVERASDPEKNFVVLEDDRVRVRLAGWKKDFALEELDSVSIADEGAGPVEFWFNMARIPRRQHVLIRLRKRKWFLPFIGGWPTSAVPLDVVEAKSFVPELRARLG